MSKFIMFMVVNGEIELMGDAELREPKDAVAYFVDQFNDLMDSMETPDKPMPRPKDIYELMTVVNMGIDERFHDVRVRFNSGDTPIQFYIVKHSKTNPNGMGIIRKQGKATGWVDHLSNNPGDEKTYGMDSLVPINAIT